MSAPRPTSRAIPSLDGLRAISIGLVVFAHLAQNELHGLADRLERRLDLGVLGVRIFFVISGFLISALLLGEHDRTARISLPKFYFRRTFRIFPPFYLYLAIVGGLGVAHVLDVPKVDLGLAAGYVSNFGYHPSWDLGHTWSLSVEEQFYFLWPAMIALLAPRRALVVAATYVLAAPALRVLAWYAMPDQRWVLERWFPFVADSLACGCLLAGLQGHLAASDRYRRFQSSPWALLAPAAILAGEFLIPRPVLFAGIGETLLNVGIALSLDWTVKRPDTTVGRVLNSRPLVVVGTMSYSIYLWQQPFLRASGAGIFAGIAAAFACAAASYFLVERTFLGLRDRIERRLFAPPTVA